MGRHKHDTENLCIKTRKIYDWVTRQVDVPIQVPNHTKFRCNGTKEDNLAELCNFLADYDDVSVNCFLSDVNGARIEPSMQYDGLMFQEISQRQPVTVTLPNGDEVTLQRVKALVRGLITVEILDNSGDRLCKTKKPIPFSTVQTFLLCAPEGTDLDVHISYFDCDATLICEPVDLQQLDINLTICLEVQMEADVKLEIEARFCQAREEILEAVFCPTEKFPPQCPEVFPAH